MSSVASITPTIPPRAKMLTQAIQTIANQTRPVDQIIVMTDNLKEGPAPLRNRAAAMTDCDWLVFLDDDDGMGPQHVEKLLSTAIKTKADLVYPWFQLQIRDEIDNSRDPLRVPVSEDGAAGPLERAAFRPFDKWTEWGIFHDLNVIPVTVLVRRELFLSVGGFPTPGTAEWPHKQNEDMGCWQRMLTAGAKFVHLPERTWTWRWHSGEWGGNTSGSTERW